MPVTSVEKDLNTLSMTIVADFASPLQRLWDAYADPRQISKFWGPVEWPATFVRHDMATGGRSHYYMTGPNGERSDGYWEFTAVNAPHSFEVNDGFANEDGTPNDMMPSMKMKFEFEETANGSRMTNTATFGSVEQLQQLIEMGMEEGTRSAMSQIDAVLEDLATFAAGKGTELQILSDTQVRITRIIRGSAEQVWTAHNEAELQQRWLLGPDGWTMPVCEVAKNVGDSFRQEWENVETKERFGFEGELLEAAVPYRSVTTERMLNTEGPSTLNEMTLTPCDGGTLLTLVITYPDAQTRDMILSTGMVDGMETSYQRLESEVLA
ncbi:uncharacterized protein YndB with AHSA1/START domain [Neomicrococcus aestuarii]|uniref:Uncharacterized protein YndB with AHSA1/START domain n=1 Tax=Neomicrococcus aestuarii TaxID=556325 RepID=A0A7W8TTF1_9MICC|nr:SRPBCC family protein [Neomicrococcus aestuarii]MBB5512589.1 uncharacterized protein YndB with AHSA1/START domain [Neomicrococcus aestuarii]